MKYPQEMPLLYSKPADLETRLGGAIYMYRGKPYRMYYDGGKVTCYNIVNGERLLTLTTDDKDIDISSIELGYINYYNQLYKTKHVYYASRMPCKQWRQGVHPNNTMLYSYNGDEVGTSREPILFSKEFEDACQGIFPKFSEVFKLTPGESMALSHQLAINRNELGVFGVFMRCKPIGYFDITGSSFNKSPGLPDWFIDEVVKNDLTV